MAAEGMTGTVRGVRQVQRGQVRGEKEQNMKGNGRTGAGRSITAVRGNKSVLTGVQSGSHSKALLGEKQPELLSVVGGMAGALPKHVHGCCCADVTCATGVSMLNDSCPRERLAAP